MPLRVLVSGAGVAGPALAWCLSKAGMSVHVVEKAPKLLANGQNIDCHGSALAVLKEMGLLEELRRLNTTEKGTRMIGSNGKAFATFPVTADGRASATSQYEILRGDLAMMLYRASKDLPNVTYQFDTVITEVLSNDKDSVKIKLSDNTEHTFDVLVAADGQWSRVRKWCFPAESVKVIDKGQYAAYFTLPREEQDSEFWDIFIGLRSRGVTIRPDPYGTSRAMFSIMPITPEQKKEWQEVARGDRQAKEDLLHKEFADVGWQAARLLEGMHNTDDFYLQSISQIKLDAWSKNRVVCIGDAAYCPSPLTGMGAPLSILGAYTLAGELGKVSNGDVLGALKNYENIFRPFVEETQKVPSIVPGIVHPAPAWKRWLLQSLIAVIARALNSPLGNLLPKNDEEAEDWKERPHYPFLDDQSAATN